MSLAKLLYGREPATDEEWRELLTIADRTLCTPLLDGGPDWFRAEVAARIAKNRMRRAALAEAYTLAARALDEAGVEFVLIKGFTHETDADVDGALRSQGDIDLLCKAADIARGQEALQKQGFVFHGATELSDNHARPMLKPNTWQWQGDYFDPTQPVPIELHHTIWSVTRDRIATPGVDDFWGRRETRAFCDVDRLGVAALHLLRHVLRNNVRLGHAWELQRMLRRKDDAFWERWQRLHPAPLRALEVLAFRFACEWFGGEMPLVPGQDWDAHSTRVKAWFESNALAPVENLTHPNKAALWLHLELLPKFADRWWVARRRLLPLRLPGQEQATGSYLGHLARRGRYHAVALARALGASTARSKASHTSD